MKQRLLNVLVALDQLAYVLLTLGAGYPDETLSAAAWRTEQAGKLSGRIFRPLIDIIFLPIERESHEIFSFVVVYTTINTLIGEERLCRY